MQNEANMMEGHSGDRERSLLKRIQKKRNEDSKDKDVHMREDQDPDYHEEEDPVHNFRNAN